MIIRSMWTAACAAALVFAGASAAFAKPAASEEEWNAKYSNKTIHWVEGVTKEVNGKAMTIEVYGKHLKHTTGLARMNDGLSQPFSSMSRHEVEKMKSPTFKTAADTRIFFCCNRSGPGQLDEIRVGDVVRIGYTSAPLSADKPIVIQVFDHNDNLTGQAKTASAPWWRIDKPIMNVVTTPFR